MDMEFENAQGTTFPIKNLNMRFFDYLRNGGPKKPSEIPQPGKDPETIPSQEPEPNVWPRKEPEIQPGREPLTTPPTAPPDVPKPPDSYSIA